MASISVFELVDTQRRSDMNGLTHEEWLDTLAPVERQFAERIETFQEALKARVAGEGHDFDTNKPCPRAGEETRKSHKCEVYRAFGEVLVSTLPYMSECTEKEANYLELKLWELVARMEDLNDMTGRLPRYSSLGVAHCQILGHEVMPCVYALGCLYHYHGAPEDRPSYPDHIIAEDHSAALKSLESGCYGRSGGGKTLHARGSLIRSMYHFNRMAKRKAEG